MLSVITGRTRSGKSAALESRLKTGMETGDSIVSVQNQHAWNKLIEGRAKKADQIYIDDVEKYDDYEKWIRIWLRNGKTITVAGHGISSLASLASEYMILQVGCERCKKTPEIDIKEDCICINMNPSFAKFDMYLLDIDTYIPVCEKHYLEHLLYNTKSGRATAIPIVNCILDNLDNKSAENPVLGDLLYTPIYVAWRSSNDTFLVIPYKKEHIGVIVPNDSKDMSLALVAGDKLTDRKDYVLTHIGICNNLNDQIHELGHPVILNGDNELDIEGCDYFNLDDDTIGPYIDTYYKNNNSEETH